MEKSVSRGMHKMKAFLHFREIDDAGPRRRFAAWLKPQPHIAEPTAPFFTRRFADMDWIIATPYRTVHFTNGEIAFAPGEPRPPFLKDATEPFWTTYFRNIFNPARLKVEVMQSEMPRRY